MKDLVEISGTAHQLNRHGQIRLYQPTPDEFQTIQSSLNYQVQLQMYFHLTFFESNVILKELAE